MSTAPSPDGLAERVLRDRALRVEGRADAAFAARVDGLREWQSARLQATYADLSRDDRYAPAVAFFRDELYGAHDATPRDDDLARASRLLERALPANALAALVRAIDLEILSQELDLDMARALGTAALDANAYADAYRRVGRRADRELQIEALVGLGAYLDSIVHAPGLGLLVRLARRPAHAAGFGALHDFLERGFQAFGSMGGAGDFLATIRERETRILERLYAGVKDPFEGAAR
jgi:hypothetical protein